MRQNPEAPKQVKKKFNEVSPAGLGVAKNGKLRFPLKLQVGKGFHEDFNNYGQKRPKVGDFVAYALPSGILGAGTVGRIVEEDKTVRFHDGAYTIEFSSTVPVGKPGATAPAI